MSKETLYDWTPVASNDPRRDPGTALRSNRELTPEVLADCARRDLWSALRSNRELTPEVLAWCKSLS